MSKPAPRSSFILHPSSFLLKLVPQAAAMRLGPGAFALLADGDHAVWPGAPERDAELRVHFDARALIQRGSLAAHDELRLCPRGQRGDIRRVAAVMRSHQEIDPRRRQADHALQARVLEI